MSRFYNLGFNCALWIMVATISGCVSSGANATVADVIGKVTLAPTCGGPQRPGQVCEGPYANAKIEILDNAGSVIRSMTTDSIGQFRVGLPAGNYKIHVNISAMYPTCEDVPLVVSQQRTVQIHLKCDSGMR